MGFEDSLPLAAGEQLPGFEVESLIQREPLGFSYAGRSLADGTAVVINEFLPHAFAVRDGTAVGAREIEDRNALRFWIRSVLEKAAQFSQLDHPGLIGILQFFEANGTAYWVTEAPGHEDLNALLEREGSIGEAQLLRILAPVLGGLAEAHDAGALHRNIRPENIWLRADGAGALANFGLLRAPIRMKSRVLTSAATAPYGAPEEYSLAGHHGAWTDLFALGGVAYRAVCGQPPIDPAARNAGAELPSAVVSSNGRCNESLLAAIDSALLMQPGARPQNVSEWSQALQPGMRSSGSRTEAPSSFEPEQRKRSRWPMVAIPVIALAAIAYFFLLRPHSTNTSTATPAGQSKTAATGEPSAAAPTPQAATATTSENSASQAAVPNAAPAADSGSNLEQLAQDLMARDKKALSDLRDQQKQAQANRQESVKQAQSATTTTQAPAAAAPTPASPSADDARAKALEEEIARLRAAAQETKQKTDEAASQAGAQAATEAAAKAQAQRDQQKRTIAQARANCAIPAMDLSANGTLTYETAGNVAGAQRLGNGSIRLPEVTTSDGRTATFIITPDSCARIEH